MERTAERDCALVLVTHDDALAQAVCDRSLRIGAAAPVPV